MTSLSSPHYCLSSPHHHFGARLFRNPPTHFIAEEGLEVLILLPPSPEYWIIDGAVHGAEGRDWAVRVLDTQELAPSLFQFLF